LLSVPHKSQPGNEFSHHVPHETIGGDFNNDKVPDLRTREEKTFRTVGRRFSRLKL